MKSGWKDRSPPTREEGIALAGLIVAVGGLALVLIFGQKPWDLAEGILARASVGKAPKLSQDIPIGLWWAAAFNAVLCVVLLLTRRWWTRPWKPRPVEGSTNRIKRSTRGGRLPAIFYGLLLIAAVVLAGFLRYPLASKSLWWDEMFNLKRATMGRFIPPEAGAEEVVFLDAGWDSAAWYYKKPTNHVSFSLASRACLKSWQAINGRAPHEFDEFVVRMPAFAAALLSVAAVAVLGCAWGCPLGGLAAAFLLAIHPWHVRYGIDGRAFSFLVLLCATGALAMSRAVRTGRWRWWLAFGLNQALIVWSFPHAVMLAGVFFLAGSGAVIVASLDGKALRIGLWRFFVVNVLAGMAFLQVFAPALLQMTRWPAQAFRPMDWGYFSSFLTNLAFGMEHDWPRTPEAEGIPTFFALSGGNGELQSNVLWASVAVLVIGILVAMVRNRFARFFLPVFAGAMGLCIWLSWKHGVYLYWRDPVYALVPFVLAIGIAVESLARVATWRFSRPKRVAVFACLALAVLLPYAHFTRPMIEMLTVRPYAPMRDVVERMEAVDEEKRLPATRPRALRAGYGLGREVISVYDPWMIPVGDAAGLSALCAQARERGLPLTVFLGYRSFHRDSPESAPGLVFLDDNRLFKEVAALPGIEPQFFFRVFRYTGEPF